jgi:hypothetical protein
MILFTVLMFLVFGRLIGFAFRAAWGITRVAFTFFFLPLILIGLVIAGLIKLALPILLIVAVISLLKNAFAEA